MSGRLDHEGEVDLILDMPTLIAIIAAARAADEVQEEAVNEPIQDPENPEDVSPREMGRAVAGMIGNLNEDEQAALIALTWIGRGDFDATEWTQVLRQARERNVDGTAPHYLGEMPLLGELLSEGLAALGRPPEEEG